MMILEEVTKLFVGVNVIVYYVRSYTTVVAGETVMEFIAPESKSVVNTFKVETS
jgi:hypothetical protein